MPSAKTYALQRRGAAVLVIDEQTRLLPAVAEAENMVKNTGILLEAARAYGLPAFYTEQYPKGLGGTEARLRTRLEALGAFRMEKVEYDAFLPPLAEALQAAAIRQIIVTGAEAHICVFQTVRAFLQAGYSVFVPQDAVASRTIANRDNALALFRDMGAVVTNTETLLFDLMQSAKDPHFKALQALIK